MFERFRRNWVVQQVSALFGRGDGSKMVVWFIQHERESNVIKMTEINVLKMNERDEIVYWSLTKELFW